VGFLRERITMKGHIVMARGSRDIERIYSTDEVVAKLRRLADALEGDRPFRIQVGGVRVQVPQRAKFSIEHERDDDEEEIEFQLKWRVDPRSEIPSEGTELSGDV
jgi:amphi-Trp domain-containing protein